MTGRWIEFGNLASGERVRILNGPFSGFEGQVAGVKPAERLVEIEVELFARKSSVEIFFLDVERVTA